MFKYPLGDCVSSENNTYVGLSTKTLSRPLTMHLNDSSSIALHLKTHSIPKSKFRKILVENTTIIALQIQEAQHIKIKNLELLATLFWNAFTLFFFKYSIFLDNILFPLIAFCFKFVGCHCHVSFIQLFAYIIL